MSLINDALKTAQRAKQARESGVRAAPVLVPLKSKPITKSFSWMRALLFGGVFAVVAGVGWLAMQRVKAETLRPLQPTAPVLLGDVPSAAADSARAPVQTVASVETPVVQQQLPAPKRATPRRTRLGPARTQTTTVAPSQGAGAQNSAARPPSGLRIAVEQPRDANAAELFTMAVTAHRAGDLISARSLYERVLLIAPGDVDAMNNLGVLFQATHDLDRAEQLLRRAVSLAPRNANVWSNFGNVLRDRGQTNDAIAAYQHALTIDSQHAGARISLAQQYLAISAFPEARRILEALVAENPSTVEAQYTLGQVLEQQGDRAGAVRAYSAFTRLAPSQFAADVERVRRRIEALSR